MRPTTLVFTLFRFHTISSGMSMFQHIGLALRILREWRGKNVRELAAAAGMGKSQLSKYENGRELPKLASLEKLLHALAIRAVDFFSLVTVLDDRLASLTKVPQEPRASECFLSPETKRAFETLSQAIFDLHRAIVEETVNGVLHPTRRRPEGRHGR